MKTKIAINGFGRIGRLTFRELWSDDNVEIVAINDLTNNETLAHLLKYDSAQGVWDVNIQSTEDHLIIDGKQVPAMSERNPENLPWKDLAVDVLLECTGVFRTKESAGLHLKAGAKKVILSAPAKDKHFTTIVLGINDELIQPDVELYSNASCTTNCLAPVIKVIFENFGFEQGAMTTVHAYTADQRIQDAPHSDLRRARAAAVNIIPTTTGAASAVQKVYPQVEGKLFAQAIRVPVITGSLVDLTCIVEKDVTRESVNEAFRAAAQGDLKGILEYSEDPLVSSDIIGNPASSIFDSLLTNVSGKMIKVTSWYDNEAGYAARLADMALTV